MTRVNVGQLRATYPCCPLPVLGDDFLVVVAVDIFSETEWRQGLQQRHTKHARTQRYSHTHVRIYTFIDKSSSLIREFT